MSFYQFHVPTKIIHDVGLSRNFAHDCLEIGLPKALFVTDAGVRRLGLCDPVIESLKEGGVEIVGVFDQIPHDSSLAAIKACAQRAQELGAVGLIAMGGGSVLDTAKAANVIFTLGGDFKKDYSGAQTIQSQLKPLVAIPTTAGTGSEVTGAVVVFDEESQSKMSLIDEHLCPALAILDPELTVGLPIRLTAATALDALTHAVEAVLSVQRSPMSDVLAFEAIRLIHTHLQHVLKEPANMEARSQLLLASNMAGLAFHHAMVGVVHAVAHAVGAVLRAHHGEACSVFLPFGLEYNFEVSLPQIASLAPSLDVSFERDETITAHKVIQAIRSFLKTIHEQSGIALNYRDLGMTDEHLLKVAELAVQEGCGFYNPRPVVEEELKEFVKKAM